MNRFTLIFMLSTMLTVVLYSAPIFIPGLELLLLPVLVIIFGIGIFGILTLPFFFYKIFKRRVVSMRLKYIISAAIGFCIGLILNKPISSWDEEQRNLSGKIVSTEIEKFKQENGYYPEALSALNRMKLDHSLPTNYKTDRFIYRLTGDSYDLDIPIPIMDRWHWNGEAQEFEYDDF